MTAPGPAAPSPYPELPGRGEAPPSADGVPAPPPGPGVAPPFAAPPTEGGRRRLWLGLGVGALALLICCGGGGTALVGLTVSSIQATEEQGEAITDAYYGALVRKEYGKAYDALCDAAQRRESRSEFARRVQDEPAVASYRIGDVDPNALTVPVDVTFSGGGRDVQTVTLAPDQQTAGLEVCGVN